jgi:nucleotide-binding universal stress UspA family protein
VAGAIEPALTVLASRTRSLPDPGPALAPAAGPLRILVVVDGSARSRDALREAVRIAGVERARLTIACVVARTPWWTFLGPSVPPWTPDDLLRARLRDAETHLAQARRRVPGGIPITTRVLRGRPARALVREVRTTGHDLVVICPARSLRAGISALARDGEASVLVVRRGAG